MSSGEDGQCIHSFTLSLFRIWGGEFWWSCIVEQCEPFLPGHVASPGVRGGFHGSDAQRAHVEAMRGMPKWRGRNGLTRLGTRHLRTNAELFRFFRGWEAGWHRSMWEGSFFLIRQDQVDLSLNLLRPACQCRMWQWGRIWGHLAMIEIWLFSACGNSATCSFIFQAQCSEGTETTRRGGHKNNVVRVVLAIDVQCLFTSALSYSQHFLTFQKARIVCSGPWIRWSVHKISLMGNREDGWPVWEALHLPGETSQTRGGSHRKGESFCFSTGTRELSIKASESWRVNAIYYQLQYVHIHYVAIYYHSYYMSVSGKWPPWPVNQAARAKRRSEATQLDA